MQQEEAPSVKSQMISDNKTTVTLCALKPHGGCFGPETPVPDIKVSAKAPVLYYFSKRVLGSQGLPIYLNSGP